MAATTAGSVTSATWHLQAASPCRCRLQGSEPAGAIAGRAGEHIERLSGLSSQDVHGNRARRLIVHIGVHSRGPALGVLPD